KHDFAVNVRVAEPPEWLLSELTESLSHSAKYPDQSDAITAIAERHHVSPASVLPTAGAAEAFTLIAAAAKLRWGVQRPAIIHPQFTEPEYALQNYGLAPEHILLSPETGFRLPQQLDTDPDLLVVGNPTNPTGVWHADAAIRALGSDDCIRVVDEAFADMVPQASSITGGLSRMLVCRSLTKTWGLAGLRVGYIVGDEQLVADLRELQPHWPVSTPALRAIELCLRADPAQYRDEAHAQREHQIERLNSIPGLHAWPSAAPFGLVNVTGFLHESRLTGAELRTRLARRGIAVRRCDTFPGLDDTWLRLAVRPEREVDVLVAALAEIAAESKP
ncbi:MAG: hypothetical protein CSA63_00155, partial [Propionibacterium sp.]